MRHCWMASLPAPLLLPVEGALGMELTLPHLFAAGLLSPEFRVGFPPLLSIVGIFVSSA